MNFQANIQPLIRLLAWKLVDDRPDGLGLPRPGDLQAFEATPEMPQNRLAWEGDTIKGNYCDVGV
jgi:hypothetical protein